MEKKAMKEVKEYIKIKKKKKARKKKIFMNSTIVLIILIIFFTKSPLFNLKSIAVEGHLIFRLNQF